MKITPLSSTLLGLAALAGCATDPAIAAEECLPGDIDCAPVDVDGKADGFDAANDPSVMAQRLEYRLESLPRSGRLTKPIWKAKYPEAVGRAATAWADTYWPTADGSHNVRWQGAFVRSPLEKYDAAFNSAPGCLVQPPEMFGSDAKLFWDRYAACAGPAAQWQTQNYQDVGRMHDGIDNDGDGVIDDAGPTGEVDGVAGWWGTCHAWTPAALLVPEPQRAVVMNGIRFEVGDIKALIQNAYDNASAVMLGGRCNAASITHTATGSANDPCSDVNPGSLHVVLTNFIGKNQLPLIEDRTANYEVWNQPIVGYDVTEQTAVSASAANACVGASGTTWQYNRSAARLFEVRTTVQYITESAASNTPHGFANSVSEDRYHYILELSSAGKVLGGRYCTDSTNTHVDFLWSPTGDHRPTNPHVSADKIDALIKASVAR